MQLRAMTFNIRFDNPEDEASGNRWPSRVESVVATVRRHTPDVVGFQEARRSQLEDLCRSLPEYRALGKPREAGEVGEYVPLLFDERRFDAVQYGDFWLSDTPDLEGSLGWDAPDPRHCTWAVLRDRPSRQQFGVFNTHLDVWGAVARVEGARLILHRTELAAGLPFIVMGDLNSGEQSEALQLLRSAGLVDTYRCLHPDETDVGTVHSYELTTDSEKIDYVLTDHSWEVVGAGIIRELAAGRLPSDHYPVYADLRLSPGDRPTADEEEVLLEVAEAELT
jgi:endonuclease/exonuclease/phosphatase family metal-dependent hydrolase